MTSILLARIGFAEDAQAVSGLDIYVDFMSIDSEHAITDECTVDLTNMIVKIPASYKDSILRFAGTCRMHLISIVMIRMKNIYFSAARKQCSYCLK